MKLYNLKIIHKIQLMVYNRKRFWHYITELKNDSFFSKYIIFN